MTQAVPYGPEKRKRKTENPNLGTQIRTIPEGVLDVDGTYGRRSYHS